MRAARIAAVSVALWPLFAYSHEEIRIGNVPTRPGVTVQVLLIKPERPLATLLLFPGGAGHVSLRPDGTTGYRGFPMRDPRLFARHGFMTAVINAPSSDPLITPGRHFRRDTAAGAEDVAHVVSRLRSEAAVPVWLVGHSAGSTSVANAAIRLRTGLAGIVLISSENGKADLRSGYLDELEIEAIVLPTLVVHHEQDACEYTLFRNTPRLMSRLLKAPKAEMLSFTGGGPVEGDPCGSLHYHGFPGLESEVASRISEWIKSTLRK